MTEQSQLGLTPSATVGPYFAYRMADTARYGTHDLAGGNLITPDAAGERVRILGHVHDGAGAPVNDAFIEIWQADAHGRYAHLAAGEKPNSSFKGFGRAGARNGGAFAFETIKPGLVPGPGGRMQAPHLNAGLFARGVVRRLFTRIYFAGEPGNAADPILALVPEERRATLIAARDTSADSGGVAAYRFNIHIQGPKETVFFEA